MRNISLTIDKTIKKSQPFISLITAVLLLSEVIILLIDYRLILNMLLAAIIIFMSLYTLNTFISVYNSGKRLRSVLYLSVNIILIILFYELSGILGLSIIRLHGLLIIAVAFIRGLIFMQCIIEKLHGKFRNGFASLISFIIGTAFLLSPEKNINLFMLLLGIYLFLHALISFSDFFIGILNFNSNKKIKRHIRIPLPNSIVHFIPIAILKLFNKYFKPDTEYKNTAATEEYSESELEVFVHVGNKGFQKFGHVDICYNGNVYTYGQYDHHTFVLGGAICEGTLMIVPRKEYLDIALNYSQKLITGFKLKLDKKQFRIINNQFMKLYDRLEEWYCDAKKAELKIIPTGTYDDYASIVYLKSKAKMYKVTEGRFKNYFIFNTNCVALADYLIGPSGLDMVGINGIVSPGSYYALLNDMYNRGSDMIIEKNIYKAVPEQKS